MFFLSLPRFVAMGKRVGLARLSSLAAPWFGQERPLIDSLTSSAHSGTEVILQRKEGKRKIGRPTDYGKKQCDHILL